MRTPKSTPRSGKSGAVGPDRPARAAAGAPPRTVRRALLGALVAIAVAGLAWAVAQSTLRGTLAPSGTDDAPAGTVTYTAHDGLQSWSGTAPIASVEVGFDPTDLASAQVRVVVRSDAFDSGVFLRDANARRIVFESAEHPTLVFVATAVRSDPVTLPRGAERRVELRGRLSMHGVERTVETSATVRRDGDRLAVSGELSVLLSDFDMHRPTFLALRVADEVTVAYDLAVELEPGGS